MNEIGKLAASVSVFRTERFPEYNQLMTLKKLLEEVKEAIDEIENTGEEDTYALRLEYADMLILLLGAWSYGNRSVRSLIEATEHKMYINQFREWPKPDNT